MDNTMYKPLMQSWPVPTNPKPIVIIGAGDIVNDAHLPAYKAANFDIAGLFDIDRNRAEKLGGIWRISNIFDTMEHALSEHTEVIYDIATPPKVLPEVLQALPDGAAVLMQKPMGENLEAARRIRDICKRNRLKAAVNFQLRYSPMMLAVRDAVRSGLLGDILDVEFQINILTPWSLFPFLKNMDRVEIAIHSIHYLDLIRSLIGVPKGAFARSLADSRIPDLKQTRTSIILDYGTSKRVALSVNHNHNFGSKFQTANIRIEGSKACMHAKLGVLLDYPRGERDELWLCKVGKKWTEIKLDGSWFPDAFAGVMSNVQRFDSGEDKKLLSSVDDSLETMALVEACYKSLEQDAMPLQLD